MSALSYLSWPTLGVSKHIQISQERKMKGNYLHLKVPIAPQFWEAKWTPPQSCALHLLLKRTACLVPSDGLWLRTCRWQVAKASTMTRWHIRVMVWNLLDLRRRLKRQCQKENICDSATSCESLSRCNLTPFWNWRPMRLFPMSENNMFTSLLRSSQTRHWIHYRFGHCIAYILL